MHQNGQQQHEGSLGSSNGSPHGLEKDRALKEKNDSNTPGYPEGYDNQNGEVYDPYGGKKLGMVRVCNHHLFCHMS